MGLEKGNKIYMSKHKIRDEERWKKMRMNEKGGDREEKEEVFWRDVLRRKMGR